MPAEIRDPQRVQETQVPKPRRQIPDMLQMREDRDEPEPTREVCPWKPERCEVRAVRQDFFLH